MPRTPSSSPTATPSCRPGGSGATPLAALRDFLDSRVGDLLSFVHLLPFYPYTSDDGFAVEDFRRVRPDLGGWDDIAALAERRRVVFDGVVNHVSASSAYLKGYLAGDPRYADFFIDLPPDTDTRSVLRTRNSPPPARLPRGQTAPPRWLWTTFSRDQPDLNFHNPEVLLEILDVLLGYAARGASMIRLDAIPYLWKQLGTSCAHLPQTHELIRLFRDVLDAAAPHVLLLSETNVPHQENIAYFGDAGDEAQMIYNFALAPLYRPLPPYRRRHRPLRLGLRHPVDRPARHLPQHHRHPRRHRDAPHRRPAGRTVPQGAHGALLRARRRCHRKAQLRRLHLALRTQSRLLRRRERPRRHGLPLRAGGPLPRLAGHPDVPDGHAGPLHPQPRRIAQRLRGREAHRTRPQHQTASNSARKISPATSTIHRRSARASSAASPVSCASAPRNPPSTPTPPSPSPGPAKELFAVRRESACGQILFALHNLAGNPAAFTPQAHDGPARWRDLLDREEGEGAVPIAPYQIRWITRR
ncbi:MAG: alpha-amylase family glycosyl hydrolase [Kiritimatiellia bacterium]